MKNISIIVAILFSLSTLVANAADRETIQGIIDINNANIKKLEKVCSYANYDEKCSLFKDIFEISQTVKNLSINLLFSEIGKDKYRRLVYHTFYEGDEVNYSYNDSSSLKVILVGLEHGYDSVEFDLVEQDYLMDKMTEKMDSDQRMFATYDNNNWYFSAVALSGSCSINGIDNTPVCRDTENKNKSAEIVNNIIFTDTLGISKYYRCYDSNNCKGRLVDNNFITSKLFAKHFGKESSITVNSIILNLLENFSYQVDVDKEVNITINEGEIKLFY